MSGRWITPDTLTKKVRDVLDDPERISRRISVTR
jgi:hypothetical protein